MTSPWLRFPICWIGTASFDRHWRALGRVSVCLAHGLRVELTQAQFPTASPDNKPIPVKVHQPPAGLATLRGSLTPIVQPITTTGIVLILVVFIMLQREDLRNRFIRLTGTSDLEKTTAAFDVAAKRLRPFFLTQLRLNAGFSGCSSARACD
jgi:hypothetical protein